jgi:ABC-type iron transport system FetAB permease component
VIPVGNLLAGAISVAIDLRVMLMCMTVVAAGVSVVVALSPGVRSLPSRSHHGPAQGKDELLETAMN